MSKVENIEREIRDFTPSELAAFRRWFLEFDAQVGTAKSKRIFGRVDWTSSQTKLSPHIAPGRVKRFETFCRSEFLAMLSDPSKVGSQTRG